MESLNPPQNSAPNHNKALPSNQNAIPPLLRIPPELRILVYEYFVILDQHFWSEECPMPLESSILQINRQIRDEAWDYLVNGNIWIRATGDFGPYANWGHQPCLTYSGSSKKHSKWLDNQVAVHFHLAGGDWKAMETFTFAYHPAAYNGFILDLSFLSIGYSSFTVELNPAVSKRPTVFSKVMGPLYSIRGLRDVSFTGLDDDATQQVLIEQMTGASNSFESLVKIKACYYKMGHRAELEGRYSDAMNQYHTGPASTYQARALFPEGTPRGNSLQHMDTEMYIAFSRVAHKHIRRLERTAPPITSATTATLDFLCGNIQACNKALAFVGLTDSQRCRAHLYRAFAFLHYANYRRPSFIGIFNYIYQGDVHFQAASSLSYAQNSDSSNDALADLEEDDHQLCKAIQARPGPQAFKLERRRIPLLGIWKGDPGLWICWNDGRLKSKGILMKLFRQRQKQGPEGEASVLADLTADYGALGISWTHSAGGRMIPNFAGFDDTSLLPPV
ncbi:hypothetical protein PG994_014022 [Apiospora phragmitis]|uniref:Uncharacterized protein n=1 Tax=Apiospora phragmitis TaxID=2905665 RepID=A0ABR1T4W0_9PEZI